VLHLVQHLLRLRQLLLRDVLHAAQHVYLLRQEVSLPLQSLSFLPYKLEFMARSTLLLRGAALWCCVLLQACCVLLRCSM
jgi:hypothetical protein